MTVRPDENPQISTDVESQDKKLSKFMVTSIIMIAVVGFISILLLMFGDFDEVGVRVFSTLMLFAAFTIFIALDTRKNRSSLYMMVSQIGHIYMLGLSLILIWASLIGRHSFFDEEEIIMNLIGLILIVKTAIVVIQFISKFLETKNSQLSGVSRLTMGALGLTAVLYSIPLAFSSFLDFSDFYWRIAVSVTLFAGLTLSIFSLMVWFFKDKNAPITTTKLGTFGFGDKNEAPQNVHNVETGHHNQGAHVAPASEERNVPVVSRNDAPVAKNPDFNPPVQSAQPWPVYPTGMPLPAKPNGRPDFNALKEFAELCARSEDQWYS